MKSGLSCSPRPKCVIRIQTVATCSTWWLAACQITTKQRTLETIHFSFPGRKRRESWIVRESSNWIRWENRNRKREKDREKRELDSEAQVGQAFITISRRVFQKSPRRPSVSCQLSVCSSNFSLFIWYGFRFESALGVHWIPIRLLPCWQKKKTNRQTKEIP